MNSRFRVDKNRFVSLLIFLVVSSLGGIVNAQDYKKECEKMYTNPFTRVALKKAPIVLSPKNNQSFTPSPNDLGVQQYLYTHIPVIACVDPKHKAMVIRVLNITLGTGENVSYPDSLLTINGKSSYLEEKSFGVIVDSLYRIRVSYENSKQWSDAIIFKVKDSVGAILSPKDGSWQFGNVLVKVSLAGYHGNETKGAILTLRYSWAPPPTPSSDPNLPPVSHMPKEIFKSSVKLSTNQKVYETSVSKNKLTNNGQRVDGEYGLEAQLRLANGQIKSDHVRFKIGKFFKGKKIGTPNYSFKLKPKKGGSKFK